MKLLFDENLSPRLVDVLSADSPDSVHVRSVGLEAAEGRLVWEFAQNSGFVIVSKDGDFHQMSFLRGAPPKVVWVRLGNATTTQLAQMLRSRERDISRFEAEEEAAFLILT